MILHQHKLIFIHIPKTGGTSIEYALTGKEKSQHKTISDFETEYPDLIKKYFKFTVVRNPWDRLVSGFFYYKSGGNQSKKDKAFATKYGCNFKSFVEQIDSFDSRHFLNKQLTYINIGGINVMDRILRFETLSADFKKLAIKLNIQQITLNTLRQSKHKHYTEYYDDKTREIVAKKYAQDIEYFDYKYGE